MTKPLHILLPLALLSVATPAMAQDDDSRGWIVTVGPGVAMEPRFPGSDKLEAKFWPIVAARREGSERRFYTPDDSFGLSLTDDPSFRFGPAVEIERGRQEDDVPGLDRVKSTIEAGAFLEYFAGSFRLRADFLQGINGHKGLVGEVGADFISGDPDDQLHFSIGPRASFASGKYVRAFYGISPAESVASGLAAYDPDGGFHSIGALAFSEYKLSPRFAVQAYGRYDRLQGDAADSPLVRSDYGSRNQFEVGAGITYSFNIF